ncbi:soluble quino protein glucose dehydrogenase [Choiromyces venosus 120613-1]|uniref:Soluble quino protein glucose dehydrogenase n=1 Tax=Choiromyces venosus 120613-1 TaxID=1336337 RepID=A0A3N4K454_9PEZI|nr:soluble quino protein glucose dehydrogenase [Choiromyces venosus 120613-1]
MFAVGIVLCVLVLLGQTSALGWDPTCRTNEASSNYPIPSILDGYTYQLLTDQLRHPRSLLFDHSGNILVSGDPDGINVLKIRDNGIGCIIYDGKFLLEGTSELKLTHGLALSKDGKTLFASSADEVYSWRYDARSSAIDNSSRKVVVTGMNSEDHTTRTLLTSDLYSDVLLVSRGSNQNIDAEAKDITKGKCMIKAFSLSKTEEQNFTTQGNLLGWGLRNSVGMGEDKDGAIWAVENSADGLFRDNVDIRQNSPAEELNSLGNLIDTAFEPYYIAPNYGYPYCFAAWNHEEIPSSTYDIGVGDQFAVVMNSSFTDTTCRDKFQAPRLSFQAHMAPLDIKFHPNTGHAWITFHGSWDRDVPVGYAVSVVEFENGQPKEPRNSMNSLINIMWNTNITGCPQRCFRPVGIAFDSFGRAFVTSDSTGEIYIITPPDPSQPRTHGSNNTWDSDTTQDSSKSGSSGHISTSFDKIAAGVAVICILLLRGMEELL